MVVAGGDLLLSLFVGILRLHKDVLLFDDEVSPGLCLKKALEFVACARCACARWTTCCLTARDAAQRQHQHHVFKKRPAVTLCAALHPNRTESVLILQIAHIRSYWQMSRGKPPRVDATRGWLALTTAVIS